ncbi:MAG: multidrug transporter [Thiopseudomonas sp.]
MKPFRMTAAALALTMAVGSMPAMAGHSADPYHDDETPEAYAMVADAVIARPLLLAATVIGTGVFVVTLPFTLASGSVGKAGKALVVEPGEATFVRCLGCTKPGYGNADDQ